MGGGRNPPIEGRHGDSEVAAKRVFEKVHAVRSATSMIFVPCRVSFFRPCALFFSGRETRFDKCFTDIDGACSRIVWALYAQFNGGKEIDEQECAAFYVLPRERIYAASIGMTYPKGTVR